MSTYTVPAINMGVWPKKLNAFTDPMLSMKAVMGLPDSVHTGDSINAYAVNKAGSYDAAATAAASARATKPPTSSEPFPGPGTYQGFFTYSATTKTVTATLPEGANPAWVAIAEAAAATINGVTEESLFSTDITLPCIAVWDFLRVIGHRLGLGGTVPSPGHLFIPGGAPGLHHEHIHGTELTWGDSDRGFVYVDLNIFHAAARRLEASSGIYIDNTATLNTPIRIKVAPKANKKTFNSVRVLWEREGGFQVFPGTGEFSSFPSGEKVLPGLTDLWLLRSAAIATMHKDGIVEKVYSTTCWVYFGASDVTAQGVTFHSFNGGGAADSNVSVTGAVVKIIRCTELDGAEAGSAILWRFSPWGLCNLGAVVTCVNPIAWKVPLFKLPADMGGLITNTPADLEPFRISGSRTTIVIAPPAATAEFYDNDLGVAEAAAAAAAEVAKPPPEYPEFYTASLHTGYGASIIGHIPDTQASIMPVDEGELIDHPATIRYDEEDGAWYTTRGVKSGFIYNCHFILAELNYHWVYNWNYHTQLVPQENILDFQAAAVKYVRDRWPDL